MNPLPHKVEICRFKRHRTSRTSCRTLPRERITSGQLTPQHCIAPWWIWNSHLRCLVVINPIAMKKTVGVPTAKMAAIPKMSKTPEKGVGQCPSRMFFTFLSVSFYISITIQCLLQQMVFYGMRIPNLCHHLLNAEMMIPFLTLTENKIGWPFDEDANYASKERYECAVIKRDLWHWSGICSLHTQVFFLYIETELTRSPTRYDIELHFPSLN